MPRVVDVDERRHEIASALLRVAVRDGVAAASVRSVGAEAGMSAGALRHYFSNQDELLVFALRMLEEIVRTQVAQQEWTGVPLADATQLLEMLLPVDDDTRQACRVWVEVTALAPYRPALLPVWRETQAASVDACRSAVRMIAPGLDSAAAEAEAWSLHAFVDGLTLHGTYGEIAADEVKSRLRECLEVLAERCARASLRRPG